LKESRGKMPVPTSVLVLVFPRFSEYEIAVALSVLHQGGAVVTTVGLDGMPVRGEAGLTVVPDGSLAHAAPAHVDAVVVPGADDFRHLVDVPALYEWMKKVARRTPTPILAGISSGTYVLARAGLLNNHRYTTPFPEETRRALSVFPAEGFQPDPVVADGRVLTAHGRAFVEFGITLGRLLGLPFDPSWYGQQAR
jgi:4-methyl-5(b-hydroxyethyl)-thiazole monophosphate biosynthesis